MTAKFILYEHTCIGFPHVKLKWTVDNGKWRPGYVTVKGIIDGDWSWEYDSEHPNAECEMKRFDDCVRGRFANDITVQG